MQPTNSSNNNNNNNFNNSCTNVKQIKIGNYILGATIGKGNSAVVKIATHSITRQKVAIKIFDKSTLDIEKQQRLQREIESMKRLKHHQNIIKLYEIMETAKLICLVTEYASNGELYDYIIRKKRLSEREARSIFKQIIAAVHYCHSNRIVHRDLKVENLLLDSAWKIKLADFGFASHFKTGELLDIFCGSPPYCAPELYLAKLYDGTKVDIWSLGVILYVLVCGYLPFEANNFSILRSQIINGSYKLPFFLSDDCKTLIKGMLTVDPIKRVSMNEIINHKWLRTDNENLINPIGENLNDEQKEIEENLVYKEFRNLIDKIENISIEEFVPNENVLNEISKRFNLNINDVIKSVVNNEFDSIAGIYYLTEAKLNSHSNQQNCYFQYFDGVSNFQNNNFSNLTCFNKNKNIQYPSKTSNEMLMPEPKSDFIINNQSSTNITKMFDSNENESLDYYEDQEDGIKSIEELGRDYLYRYSAIRRHTIATNSDAMDIREQNVSEHNSNLEESKNNKNTECLSQSNLSVLNKNSNYYEQYLKSNSSSNYEFDLSEEAYLPNSENLQQKSSFTPSTSNSTVDEYSKLNLNYFLEANQMQNNSLHQLANNFRTNFKKHHQLHHNNYHYKTHRTKHIYPPPNEQNQIQQNNKNQTDFKSQIYNDFMAPSYLQPPINNGRRASDGGSNISLFNQFYSLRNNTILNSNNSFLTDQEFSDGAVESGDNNYSDSCTNLDLNKSSNMNESFRHPRGSITSGIPIFTNLTLHSSGQATYTPQSSEEEEDNVQLNYNNNNNNSNCLSSNNSMRCQRRSSIKARHEPYMDSSTQNAASLQTSTFPYLSRPRDMEQSFSGSSSNVTYVSPSANEKLFANKTHLRSRMHRASEPNQFDVLFANRSHLERIYNQSLNKSKSKLSINKELKMLQQENSQSQNFTKDQNNNRSPTKQFFDGEITDFKHDLDIMSETNELNNSNIFKKTDFTQIGLNNLRTNNEQLNECDIATSNLEIDDSSKLDLNNQNNIVINSSQSNTLQIIQEEQTNEINMLSSESEQSISSFTSNPSITARSTNLHHKSSLNEILNENETLNNIKKQHKSLKKIIIH